ncbi:MAG: L-histidine N(alpha)-methyltransferase, partial [Deltaproteobacteria bacterium]|nr:L-histidine N(alpha)-methyltransferase [Deltaproteobacteria bacterium]
MLFPPEDVLESLFVSEKRLSSKFFYDQNGSDLFQKITELPEYCLTKAEIEILDDNLDGISELVGEDSALIEFGSGPPLKSRMLL